MSIVTDIGAALEMFAHPQKSDNCHVITTQYLYPSNGHVSVQVMPGLAGNLTVSDGGGALRVLSEHGLDTGDHKRIFSVVKKYKPLVADGGEIRARRLPKNPDLLGTAIIMVARASAEVAEHGMTALRPPRSRDLENEILKVLQSRVGPSRIKRRPRMTGSSNRQYTFDFAVPQGKRGLIIIDAVEPEAASLQAKFTAHMDIKSTGTKTMEQRIVYDDQRDWKAEDLALLQMSATLVPLSKFRAEVRNWH
jgi:hypothetical protein